MRGAEVARAANGMHGEGTVRAFRASVLLARALHAPGACLSIRFELHLAGSAGATVEKAAQGARTG